MKNTIFEPEKISLLEEQCVFALSLLSFAAHASDSSTRVDKDTTCQSVTSPGPMSIMLSDGGEGPSFSPRELYLVFLGHIDQKLL